LFTIHTFLGVTDLCSTQGRQEKSITFDDVVHRDIEALGDNVS